jgi:hypothetical protein
MAIPKARFIGLSSGDPDGYGLPRNVGIKLNDKDISRAKELLKYRWFQKKPWQEEIQRMLASGLKYELDALANKDFRYLTKTYLPRMLKEEDWLDSEVESSRRAFPPGAGRSRAARRRCSKCWPGPTVSIRARPTGRSHQPRNGLVLGGRSLGKPQHFAPRQELQRIHFPTLRRAATIRHHSTHVVSRIWKALEPPT